MQLLIENTCRCRPADRWLHYLEAVLGIASGQYHSSILIPKSVHIVLFAVLQQSDRPRHRSVGSCVLMYVHNMNVKIALVLHM